MYEKQIDIERCKNRPFFWHDYDRRIVMIYHCNFYPHLAWKLGFSPKDNKHPDCKVVRIVVSLNSE